METIEYLLRAGGDVVKRHVVETPVNVPDALFIRLQGEVFVPFRQALTITNWGTVNLIVTNGVYSYWTVPVQRILLRAPFKVGTDKLMVPIFGNKEEPPIEVKWDVPEGMRLVMLLMLKGDTNGCRYQVTKSYLYAADTRPEYWKLPLPNIYDDGAICEGRKVRWFPSALEAVVDMLATFDASNWNADLWSDTEKTHRMFRFKPIEGGFETQAPETSWITLCRKTVVGNIQKWLLL